MPDRNAELKDCPFCGGWAAVNEKETGAADVVLSDGRIEFEYQKTYHVECCSCGMSTMECTTEQAATAVWNRRVECTKK